MTNIFKSGASFLRPGSGKHTLMQAPTREQTPLNLLQEGVHSVGLSRSAHGRQCVKQNPKTLLFVQHPPPPLHWFLSSLGNQVLLLSPTGTV